MLGQSDPQTLRDCEPRRICIIKPSALGDVVQALPVLDGLHARWPRASISWVIRHDLAPLVAHHPLIDECLPYVRRGGPREYMRLLRQLRSRRFDLVIDLQGLARTAMMCRATGARLRVGLESSRDAAWLAHNVVVPGTSANVPAHQRYLRSVEPFGVANGRQQCTADSLTSQTIHITDADRLRAGQMLSNLPRLIVAVHPGAMWASKRWPVGRFAAVVARAVRDAAVSVVIVGGAEETRASQRFADSLRAVVPHLNLTDLTGRTSIGQLAGVLAQVDVLLSNDSGPMHLAAGLNTPVVGLFTSTSYVISGPPPQINRTGPQHELLAAPVACGGCYRRRCPLTSEQQYSCHRELSVDDVDQALMRCLLDNAKSSTIERSFCDHCGSDESTANGFCKCCTQAGGMLGKTQSVRVR